MDVLLQKNVDMTFLVDKIDLLRFPCGKKRWSKNVGLSIVYMFKYLMYMFEDQMCI